MKKILITGINSYIGECFEQWVKSSKFDCEIDKIGLRDSDWKNLNLSQYNSILHLAAIVHKKGANETDFHDVNTKLTLELAKKAKEDGVGQFIFMSTASVYADNTGRKITGETLLDPKTAYGISKLEAENGLLKLVDARFKIAIIRPPMVYGKGCKGNYARISKLVRTIPFFPNIKNNRSMIYVSNLCELVRLIIKNEDTGVYCPQNAEYVSTCDLVTEISLVRGKKIGTTGAFNPLIRIMIKFSNTINKMFGDFVYDKDLSEYKENYQIIGFEKSIELTET